MKRFTLIFLSCLVVFAVMFFGCGGENNDAALNLIKLVAQQNSDCTIQVESGTVEDSNTGYFALSITDAAGNTFTDYYGIVLRDGGRFNLYKFGYDYRIAKATGDVNSMLRLAPSVEKCAAKANFSVSYVNNNIYN